MKRLNYIDVAKLLLMLCVIYGHLYLMADTLPEDIIKIAPAYIKIRKLIYLFHMPAFFIIAGMFLNVGRPFKEYCIKKAKRLLIPYVCFELLAGVFLVVIGTSTWKEVVYNFVNLITPTFVNWFLLALFVASILSYFLLRAPLYCQYGYIILTIIMMSLYIPDRGKIIFIYRIVVCTVFALIGYEIRKNLEKFMAVKLAPVYIGILIAEWYIVEDVNVYMGTVGNPVLFFAGGFSGTMLMLMIAKCISNDILGKAGKETMIVVGTHVLIILAIKSIFRPELSYINLLYCFLAVLIIEAALIYIKTTIQKK